MEVAKRGAFDGNQDFSSAWCFSDAVLVVEGRRFHVHRSTLSMWSPVFEKMFHSPFAERDAKEVALPGKRQEEIEVFLRLVYSNGTKQKVNEDNYFYLLELAEEYQMDEIRNLCIKFMSSSVEESNCLHLCNVADRFCLKEVMSKCIEEARYRASKSLLNDEDYEDLTPELKHEVCMERIKELEKFLQEYTAACSKLVERVYHTTAERLLHEEACQNIANHRAFVTVSHGFVAENVLPFDVDCKFCRQRVEQADWNKVGAHFYVLKDYLTKLHALQHSNRIVAGIN